MDLNNIEVFYYVAKEKSFTLAAELLFMTQSSVTKKIKALESELGSVLLKRSTKSVELTENGREFFKIAEKMIIKLRNFEGEIGEKNGIKIGIVGVFSTWAQRIILDFMENYYLNIEFTYGSQEYCRILLENQEIDILFSVEESLKKDYEYSLISSLYYGLYATSKFSFEKPYTLYVAKSMSLTNAIIDETLQNLKMNPQKKLNFRADNLTITRMDFDKNILFANCELVKRNSRFKDLELIGKSRDFRAYLYYLKGCSPKIFEELKI